MHEMPRGQAEKVGTIYSLQFRFCVDLPSDSQQDVCCKRHVGLGQDETRHEEATHAAKPNASPPPSPSCANPFHPLKVTMLRELFRCSILCNSAERVNPTAIMRPNADLPQASSDSTAATAPAAVPASGVKGDASDTAFFHWAEITLESSDVASYRSHYPTVAALPFNSRNK